MNFNETTYDKLTKKFYNLFLCIWKFLNRQYAIIKELICTHLHFKKNNPTEEKLPLTILNELRGRAEPAKRFQEFACGWIHKTNERKARHGVELIEALSHWIDDINLPEDEVCLQNTGHRLVLP